MMSLSVASGVVLMRKFRRMSVGMSGSSGASSSLPAGGAGCPDGGTSASESREAQ